MTDRPARPGYTDLPSGIAVEAPRTDVPMPRLGRHRLKWDLVALIGELEPGQSRGITAPQGMKLRNWQQQLCAVAVNLWGVHRHRTAQEAPDTVRIWRYTEAEHRAAVDAWNARRARARDRRRYAAQKAASAAT